MKVKKKFPFDIVILIVYSIICICLMGIVFFGVKIVLMFLRWL